MGLPKHYEPKEAEKKWQEYWEKQGIYRFDPDLKKELFSCDTRPPTVSGKMHIGHALAYSQADYVMRFQRMLGKNIFYPFGFDDNGLATERFVEKKCKVRARDMPRPEFIKLCLNETKEAEKELKKDWSSLGISPDWSINYRTIDEWCRKTSQRSFLDLYKKGREYRKEAPTIWCPKCQTAIAQVELEDKEQAGFFNYICFGIENSEKKLKIATTRPELLSSCIAVFVNPADKRYKDLIGKNAIVPLFGYKVPIIGDKRADPKKGTGIVMCCTFGDLVDIEWWSAYNLPLKISITTDGVMNEIVGKYKGLKINDARKAIIEDLKSNNLMIKQEQITHTLNVHERCGTEVEFLVTKQWFLKYLDIKDKLLEAGSKLNWYPKHMKVRYDNWINGLQWDWCLSRQRFYGVQIPVWYCSKCDEVILAREEDLPVDPTTDKAPLDKCPKCGCNKLIPEKDIFDTWATSSLTPMIATKWKKDNKFFNKMTPMSLRSNGHDIITFWLFNTVVKMLLHEDKLPWKDVMINGHALDPKGKKMSKSKGNIVEPKVVLEKHGADAMRFWAASAKLGSDIPYQEKELMSGKKMMTKMWNASKFAIMNLEGYNPKKTKLEIIDKWIFSKLNKLIKKCTDSFLEYDFSRTKSETEKFFWQQFCDNYLEIVKDRLYNKENYSKEAVDSAHYTLYNITLAILKLMAPIMPHITEEIYHLYFAEIEGLKSIHVSDWPKYQKELADEKAELAGDNAVSVISAVRKYKSEKNLSLNKPIKTLTIKCDENTKKDLNSVLKDIKATVKAEEIVFGDKAELECQENIKLGIDM
ncbi:valine--tRNA ligase [Candidatus Woesearchaeota archaeon]|nr:valine--tRNA ligase [Candidatus Woesearchaeota archaeon]